MITITTNEGGIIINNGTLSSEPKGGISLKSDGEIVHLKSVTGHSYSFDYRTTTVDGEDFESAEALVQLLSSFKRGGGDGQGVTWDTLEGKPASIAAGNSASEARSAIGAGTSNYVLPEGGGATTYLRGDGTWGTPNNTTYSILTEADFNNAVPPNVARVVSAASLNRDITAKMNQFAYVEVDSSRNFLPENFATNTLMAFTGTDITLTLQANANMAVAIGCHKKMLNRGVTALTIAAAATVTLTMPSGMTKIAPGGEFTLWKTGVNEWYLTGDLVA